MGNYWYKQENRNLGEELRNLRAQHGLSQEALRDLIEDFLRSDLTKRGLTEDELEQYFSFDISEKLEKKIRRLGIDAKKKYTQIAISTISKYENGERAIPASYYMLVKKICLPLKE